MKLRTIATLAVLTLIVASGAALAAPVDVPNERGDAPDEPNATAGPDPADADGPPADLPNAVPDFVGELHDLIRQFLGGDSDGPLGDAIGNVTPDDGDS